MLTLVCFRAFKVCAKHGTEASERHNLTHCAVAPAELEGTLLVHPQVIDAGVIGIWSEADATEYPR